MIKILKKKEKRLRDYCSCACLQKGLKAHNNTKGNFNFGPWEGSGMSFDGPHNLMVTALG